MERVTSRSKITMIKHNKKIRARKRKENRTPSKQRVEEERFNLKESIVPFPQSIYCSFPAKDTITHNVGQPAIGLYCAV